MYKNSLYHFTKNDENSNVFILSFYLKLTAHTYLYPPIHKHVSLIFSTSVVDLCPRKITRNT